MDSERSKNRTSRELRLDLEDEADLYENAPCGYLSILPDGTIVKINRTLLDWVHYDRDDLVNKMKFQDIVTVPGRIFFDTHHFPLVKMNGSVKELNYELLTSGNERMPVLISTTEVRDERNVMRLLRMTVMDITDRKRYELELLKARRREEDERKRFTFMSDMAPVIIWTGSPSGIPDHVNKRFEKFTGYKFNRAALARVFLPNDLKVLMQKWKRSVREGMEFEMEIQMLCADGEYQWYLVRGVPYRNEEGIIQKWFGTCTNIHSQRKMQEKMDEFLSIASHELKTPITSVKANIELLLLTEPLDERKSMLSKAFKRTNSILDLVNALLDVSKIQAGHVQLNRDRVELRSIVDTAAEAILSVYPYGKVVVTDKAPGTRVFADPARLEQVVANLLSNAIKYSPGISIAEVNIASRSKEVIISVKDYGIGIESEKLDRVFDRFYRVTDKHTGNRFAGLGIGLYITREMVIQQDGRIWAESEPGKGSTFFIALPVMN